MQDDYFERLNDFESRLEFKDPIRKEKIKNTFQRLRGPEGMLGLSNIGSLPSADDLTSDADDQVSVNPNRYAESILGVLEQGLVLFKNEGEESSLFYIQKKLGHEQVRWRLMLFIITIIFIIFGIGAYWFNSNL